MESSCLLMALLTFLLLCFSYTGSEAAVGGLSPTGGMTMARYANWLITLTNGKVLAIGGTTGQIPDNPPILTGTAELYNPATGTWSLAGTMATLRMPYYALLLGNGKVLAGGGVASYDASGDGNLTSAAELYDPTANSWSTAHSMSHPHAGIEPFIMGNGKVVIAGGTDAAEVPTKVTDIYNPSTNTWTQTNMASARTLYAAIKLQSGKLLVIGGKTGRDTVNSRDIFTTECELFDPTTGTWTMTGAMAHPHGASYDPVMFSDGKVLIAGGLGNDGAWTNTAEIYNPATNTWASTANNMSSTHVFTTRYKLSGDRVFITGGADADYYYGFNLFTPTTFADIYTESTNTWTRAADMVSPHYQSIPVMLGNGNIFVAGGAEDKYMNFYTRTAEIYNPATNLWTPAGSMMTTRYAGAITIPLPDGNAMVMGGNTANSPLPTYTSAVDLYDVTTGAWSVTHLSEAKNIFFWAFLQDQRLLFPGGYTIAADGTITGSFTSDLYTGSGSFPPTITSTTPAAGAAGVSVSTTIRAVFSKAMNASTINTTTFSLNNGVTGTVSYDPATYTATFTPSANLAYNTTYTATITTGVTDSGGTHMAAVKTWSFTTVPNKRTLTVTISGNGSGSVRSTPPGIDACSSGSCVAQFNYGSSVTLVPTPDPASSILDHWTGCTSLSGSNCLVTMSTNKTVTATFIPFPPVHLFGGNYFTTFQAAYNAGSTSCTILAKTGTLTGNLSMSTAPGKSVKLKGGYDSSYSGNSGGSTIINGVLTVGTGNVTVENISIR
jgi:N-acetylneuraminic acid mutarotase